MRSRLGLLGFTAILVLVAACAGPDAAGPSGQDPSAAPSGGDVETPAPASPSAEPSEAAPQPTCPNPHGGVCLGPLAAGTYTTKAFGTELTYSVPDGWVNHEDLPGNFLVIPPTASLEEIDAGTADYIGVYDGVAAASGDCEARPQDGLDRSPDAIAAWFGAHDGLETTEPAAVTVGGLDGVVLDLQLAAGYAAGCPYEGYEGVPMVPMLIGVAPSDIEHVVLGETVTRLYLLTGENGRVLAIEVSDVPGGMDLAELDAIVDDFAFSIEP